MKDSKFVRGQIWWMEGYEVHKYGAKSRPALIISSNNINSNTLNENITVLPITSNVERVDIPTNVIFDRHNRTKNIIKCGEAVTIYKNQLVSYESTVDEETMRKVEEALKLALNLDGSTNEIAPKCWNKITQEDISDDAETEAEEIQPAECTTQEIAPYEPVLSTVTEEDKEYIELMNCKVERSAKQVKWTPESESLFMKLYEKYGVQSVMEKFQLNRNGVACKATRLRKKYPQFKSRREARV